MLKLPSYHHTISINLVTPEHASWQSTIFAEIAALGISSDELTANLQAGADPGRKFDIMTRRLVVRMRSSL